MVRRYLGEQAIGSLIFEISQYGRGGETQTKEEKQKYFDAFRRYISEMRLAYMRRQLDKRRVLAGGSGLW